jgi:uncharacterized membrane protein YhaH (DUF805 family)
VAVIAWFIGTILASIQRLHDRDMSGLWYLLMLIPYLGGLILMVIFALPGTEGDNRFGSDDRNAY